MEPLLNTADAAKILGLSKQTLEVWRCTKAYPLPFIKVGKKVMYRPRDIEKFLEARVQAGTGKRSPLAPSAAPQSKEYRRAPAPRTASRSKRKAQRSA